MARKNSSSGILALVGLIALAIIVQYATLFITLVVIGLAIWGLVKLVKSCFVPKSSPSSTQSRPYLSSLASSPQNGDQHSISKVIVHQANEEIISTSKVTLTSQKVTCAYCSSTDLHQLLRTTSNTIECRCISCGKVFFKFLADIHKPTSDYVVLSVPRLGRSDAAISGADTHQPSVSPDTVWVPCGRTVQVAGYSIPGGLLYFGNGLKSVAGWTVEPALLDPQLPTDTTTPDREGRYMNYYPSYTQIHPASRGAFLEWLAGGRKDSKANIGYVFIYFYGLERRALADTQNSDAARNDVPAIITEVKRLLSIYGANGSFHGYASRFLDALQIAQATMPLYRSPPQIESSSWEFPLNLKIALGQMARDGIPVSAEWALAWAKYDPSMPRRMPIQRCSEEFRELFKLRYIEKFGEGMKLKPNKTRIQATYRTASSSFSGQIEIPLPDLPDITRTTGPASKISELVAICTDELEGYSRYLGRNPEGRNSLEATSYLPQALLKNCRGKEIQEFSEWLADQVSSDAPVSVPFKSLLQRIPSINQSGFGKKEATAIANLLGKLQIGMEPDPRFGSFAAKPDQYITLFRISSNAPSCPSSEYSAATVVLHLASAVASADGTIEPTEERHLEEHLESWLHLSADEKVRLRAHTQWLLSSAPGMSGVKKRIELLSQEQRESLGRFLVAVAQADGYIDPSEMKILTKIYQTLGLDTQSLYSHAHAATVEPVTVQTADLIKPQGYAVPLPPTNPVDGILLDMGSIETKLAETAAVSAILNNIFTEEGSVTPQASISETTVLEVPIPGLDPESYLFMRTLASRQAWAREELEKLAADHGLMLDGTLDSINDASFDHFDGPFFEGDDPIEIVLEFVNRLEAVEPGQPTKQ